MNFLLLFEADKIEMGEGLYCFIKGESIWYSVEIASFNFVNQRVIAISLKIFYF